MANATGLYINYSEELYFRDTSGIKMADWSYTSSFPGITAIFTGRRDLDFDHYITVNLSGTLSSHENNVFSFTHLHEFRGEVNYRPPHLFTIPVVYNLPTITILPLSSYRWTAGTAITPVQFSASGTTAPYTFEGIGLPGGLSMSSTGLLTGTPLTLMQENSSFYVKVTDGTGAYNSISVPVVVGTSNQGAIVFSVPNMSGAIGVVFGDKEITASGTTVSQYAFTCSGLPTGLSYSSSTNKLSISGTPTVIGTFPVTVTANTVESYPVYGSTTFNIVIAATATVAVNDRFTLPNRAAETELTVLANDSGTGLSVVSVNTTDYGITGVARVSGGKLYYTAAPRDTSYEDYFRYTIKDSLNDTREGWVTITVSDAEAEDISISDGAITVSKNSVYSVAKTGTSLLVDLFDSVSVNSGSWLFSSISSASHGTAVCSYSESPGFVYTPATNYTGSDSIIFTVIGPDGVQRTATLSITVIEAGTLTITPVSDITLFEGDKYSGVLFNVIGGIYPYRTATISISSSSWNLLSLDNGNISGSNTQINSSYKPSVIDMYGAKLQIPEDTSSSFSISAMLFQGGPIVLDSTEAYSFKGRGYYIATLTMVDGSPAPGQTASASIKFIVYGLDGTAPNPDDDPGDPNNPGTAIIQGVLRLDTTDGDFADRKVYLYNYTTGDKVKETTSDAITGRWFFTQVAPGEYFVVGAAQGDDLNVPRDFDAMGVITVV